MDLNLIVARCGARAALAGDIAALSPEGQAALLDPTVGVPLASMALRVDGKLAIGRREGDRAIWWLVGEDFEPTPAHGLWTVPGLFRPDGGGSLPESIDVGDVWDTLTAGSEEGQWVERLARAVHWLRTSEGPLSVVCDLSHEAREAFGVLLAVIIGPTLTISVGHPDPDPAVTRVSIGPEVDGFPELSDVAVLGADPVAEFVRARIRSQPDLLLYPGGLDEEAIVGLARDETTEITDSSNTETFIDTLNGGRPLDEAAVRELVALTVQTGDPQLWEPVAKRSDAERRLAAQELLRNATALVPSRSLLEVFLRTIPRGMPLAPLCSALLEWMRRSDKPAVVGEFLEVALAEWPQASAKANRASLWTEAVRILVQTNHHREAAAAIAGPVATKMIEEGAGAAVALMWTSLPPEHQNPLRMAQICNALSHQPRGDHAAALLFRTLQGEAVEVFAANWLQLRGDRALDDDVLRVAVKGAQLEGWVRSAGVRRGLRTIRDAVGVHLDTPADPRWRLVHAALAQKAGPEESLRIAGALGATEALEPIARALLPAALESLRFPHVQLAEWAARYATVDTTTLWGWVGVAAAGPGVFDDEVIDGTVVAVCGSPPPEADGAVCRAVARQLGAAGTWTALDHARWVVRLALAPSPSGLNEALLCAMLEGLVERFDAAPHLATIVGDLFELGPEHPAVDGLLSRWLPLAWQSRMPSAFVESVRVRGIPDDVRPLWEGLLNAER